jgi:dipeptide/tripeptide permease
LAIIIGAVVMAVGHFLMAFEPMLVVALAVLIVGNGFFKPNMATQVGRLYRPGDPRRDGGYTIYYMGVNLGAFLAPLACGVLAEAKGYHWGFGLAGVGMVAGLVIYLLGQPFIVEVAGSAGRAAAPDPETGAHVPKRVMRDRVAVILILLLFGVSFWMGFEQAGNTISIWADKHTDRLIGGDGPLPPTELPQAVEYKYAGPGWEVPASWFQSVNAAFIMLLGPVFAWLWTWLDRRGLNPSTPAKVTAGVFIVGVAFLPMVWAAKLADRPSHAQLDRFPPLHDLSSLLDPTHQPEPVTLQDFLGGQLVHDSAQKTLHMSGVLSDLNRDRILQASADPAYAAAIVALAEKAQVAAVKAKKEAKHRQGEVKWEVSVPLTSAPEGYDLRWSKLDFVRYDAAAKTLTTVKRLDDKAQRRLLLAGADPGLRRALWGIWQNSQRYRTAGHWLLLHFLLATVGELCLYPVGLSMVSKLAPAKFATFLMSLWMMQNGIANWLAGALGELTDKVPPVPFFAIFVVTSMVPAVILWACLRKVKGMMHGIR